MRKTISVLAFSGVVLLAGLLAGAPYIASKLRDRKVALTIHGQLVERRVVVRQSKYGSRTRYHLLVRTESGSLIAIDVPERLYRDARVGMLVSKKEGEPLPTLGAR